MKSLNVDEVIKQIATKVRTLRLEQNMTQEELAARSDIDVRSIQRIESHNISVSLITIIKVSKGLDIELSKLFQFSLEK